MAESPRTRILEAALRCFAAKGFAATSIADIEEAAGYVARTGGTYRHFKSKAAILEAAVDAELARNAATLDDQPATLDAAARQALTTLRDQRSLMRVLFRDLDEFPELMARVGEQLIHSTYRLVAERTRAVAPQSDAAAIAALFVGSLVNFVLIEEFTGVAPGGVSDDRFIATWVRAYESLLQEESP